MKNINKKRKVISRLFTVILFLIVAVNFISPFINETYAAINPAYAGASGNEQEEYTVIDAILGLTLGSVGSALSGIVLLIIGILYLLLIMVFSPIFGFTGFPTIERIIFNGIPIFDPNFISPSDGSLAGTGVQSLIKSIYQTGYVIGGSIFVIGAMIIGMKLAITSIASEKAYYKEMIGTWLKGIVLLFTVHIIITAIFYINEQVVSALYDASDVDNMDFSITFDPPNPIGKLLTGIVNLVTGNFEAGSDVTAGGKGIGGLTMALIVKAVIGSDIVAAIAVAGLLGQTVSLIITYFKRVFVCIGLAAIAPYIVAVDFIRKLI